VICAAALIDYTRQTSATEVAVVHDIYRPAKKPGPFKTIGGFIVCQQAVQACRKREVRMGF
jgi:hypothetical protein